MPRSTHGFRFTAATLAALALAACTDSPSSPLSPQSIAVPDVASLSSSNNDAVHGHIMLTKDASQLEAFKNANKRPGGGTGISYHGGPVLQSGTKVAAVYWASAPIFNGGPAVGTTGSGASDGSLVGYFLNIMGGWRYFNINTTYTNGSG